MIELTYINEDVSETKYFKTWKSLDKFVMSQKLKKYKVKGQSPGGNIIRYTCLLYTSPSPRDRTRSRMPSSA